jgi:glycerate kinase
MADGGEGTLDALAFHRPRDLEVRLLETQGPRGRPLAARVGFLDGVAFVESREVLGLHLVDGVLDALTADSLGLGLLLARLVSGGFEGPVLVGLGGTATMEGGLGALLGLGLRLTDLGGATLTAGSVPALLSCARAEGASLLEGRVLDVLCDVRTPLLAAPGLFGPQKGLREEDIPRVRGAFVAWAAILSEWRSRRGWDPLPVSLVGGGAAGGLGYALASACGARLLSGAGRFAQWTHLSETLDGAEILIVGEGRLDGGSFEGKVVGETLALARALGVPRVLALVGRVRETFPPPLGPDSLFPCEGPPSHEAFDAAIARLLDHLHSHLT